MKMFFSMFQCERGSALHEAAMCGKSDMVQLLLDKGKRGREKGGDPLLIRYCQSVGPKGGPFAYKILLVSSEREKGESVYVM